MTAARAGWPEAMRWVIPLATFAIALLLYTSRNRFPYYYHADEPSKVQQIQSGSRNFNHPLLLLTATDLAVKVLRIDPDSQNVVIAGRWCAAIFAAIAVAGLSAIAFSHAGTAGAAWTGLLVLLHHRLAELSHFMKEDTGLLMGAVLTLLAAHQFWRCPSVWRASWLGCATAIAASGKYVGVVMLAAALPVLVSRRPFSWSVALAFSAAFLGALVLINWALVISPNEFPKALSGEVSMLNRHAGVQLSFSHFDWVKGLLRETAIPLWIFVGYHLRTVWLTRAHISMPEWILTAFPFAFGLMLSTSSAQSGRYLLPAMIPIYLFAALGIVEVWRDRSRAIGSWWRFAILAAVVLGVSAAAFRTAGVELAFRRDSRDELVKWIATHLPESAVIVEDNRVGLGYRARAGLAHDSLALKQKIVSAPFAADVGTLAGLQKRGVTHVAITDSAYQQFMKSRATSTPGFEDVFLRRQAFYKTLLSEGRIVWQRDAGKVGVLNPELRLCDITNLKLPHQP